MWSVGIDFPAKSPFHQSQKLHLRVVPFEVFINRLKVIRFSDDLMSSGRLFHSLAPSYLKLIETMCSLINPGKIEVQWSSERVPRLIHDKKVLYIITFIIIWRITETKASGRLIILHS